MTGRRTSRAGVCSLREIQFLRNVVSASMLDCNIQAGSHQAERMARQVLDAAQGVRRSEPLLCHRGVPSLERDTGGSPPPV